MSEKSTAPAMADDDLFFLFIDTRKKSRNYNTIIDVVVVR